ncbi:hypothetical protein [Lysobacter gummosus]|uniref:hypothetical protein n=1 Tax=Lysobacter gummosus TaxID=262324 RepID=UPI003636DE9E
MGELGRECLDGFQLRLPSPRPSPASGRGSREGRRAIRYVSSNAARSAPDLPDTPPPLGRAPASPSCAARPGSTDG